MVPFVCVDVHFKKYDLTGLRPTKSLFNKSKRERERHIHAHVCICVCVYINVCMYIWGYVNIHKDLKIIIRFVIQPVPFFFFYSGPKTGQVPSVRP